MSRRALRKADAVESRAGPLARLSQFKARHRGWIGYVFILPWLVSFLWFDLIPFVLNLYLSFTDYSVGVKWPNWVGLANYTEMFTEDHLYGLSLKNTIYYMGFSVPLGIIFAFAIALLLNTDIRGRTAYRTIYYIPAVVPAVAASMIWLWIFHTRYGILNQVLRLVGIGSIRWLTRPEWAKPALIIMSLWGFGAQMVIFLAGLQGIPGELYEAAEIDGAGHWHKMRYVTIPLMTPTILFNLIMGIIGGFQVFTAAFIMTNGGPLNATLFYMLHLYNNAFRYFRMGYASAMAVVLFFIILIFTLLMMRTSERWVYYGGS
ncbi:MAG: sugar ABC transporter permease [Anaerolineae bacterium]|nr:sugar ABC transporter permease [Anaerolineae bacterium]